MEKIIIALFDLLLFISYIGIGFIVAIFIQLISYRVFKFNLYKKLKYILIDKELSR